ncbi:hypothetical protein B9G55_02445 [Saccharibacillus sp. O16]|nr:hypothetical protein B9G55_02445 [Saccharibacillus sp. O16]
MDTVTQMLNQHQKIARWAQLPHHAPAIGWIVRGERFYWTPERETEYEPLTAQYEIGSITKTMTAYRLARGEQEGLWQASDTLDKLVSELAESEFARSVTLRQLATHTSGLARLAKNQVLMSMKQDKTNPYAAYTEEHLLEAVREEKLRSGAKHAYSNYGYGLLGWAMSRAAGVPASQALNQELFEPLGMSHTEMAILGEETSLQKVNSNTDVGRTVVEKASGGATLHLTESQPDSTASKTTSKGREAGKTARQTASTTSQAALLPGFAPGGRPMPHWDFTSAMAGAGAVRSTITDMLTYVEAQLGQHAQAAELEAAFLECQKEQASVAPSKGVGIGYAWMRSMRKDGTVTHWHNGATYGFSSFMAFNRDLQSGFVVLSNRGVSFSGQIKQMLGLGELSTDRAAGLVGEALFSV